MNTRLPISLLAAIALCTGSVLSFAEDAATPDVAELLRSGEILSQDAIIKRATEQHPGKVTEVELEHKCGRYIYEIDVVDDKGVKTELELDAKSGDVLSSRGDEDEDQEKNNSEKDDDDDD
jgi:hypothetical protein